MMPTTAARSGATFDARALERWATGVLVRQGMSSGPAALGAGVLVRTSLRGIDTHGLSRLSVYADQLASGEVNPQANPKIHNQHGLLQCDGDGGLGQVVAPFALDHAMDLARTSAVVACRIHAIGHLAALGTFVLLAAERGFFAILCQRTPPIMAMPGANGPAISNNPLAFALPVPGEPPLVFDMAHSVVARGHVVQALREGVEAIPAAWAIGPDGEPTTDPAQALAGAMQPIAGHKGLGLAMLVECLAGSLNSVLSTSEPTRAHAARGSAANVSAFLIVINPALAIGQGAFDASIRAWMHTLRQSAGSAARYPGQRQATCEQQRLSQGIPIAAGLLAELQALGQRVGNPFDLLSA